MHLLIFGHSFSELVAPILLLGLAFYFLNKKQGSARRNAEVADTGASGLITAPAVTNSGGSSSSPVETNDGESCSSPTKIDDGASSSSTASLGKCYEVFLSFRGQDTRNGFASHLYKGLLNAGIHAFRDDDELREGKSIGPELMAAIMNSKILIPILSGTYGESSWCLNELVQIMECQKNKEQMVLPIFYKVKPAEVGNQIGSFGEVFRKRERRLLERPSFDPTILKDWKKALAEVSKLKGKEADGDEAELVKLIVQKVLRELKKKFELVNSENLVGIDSPMKEVMEFVNNKSHATLFIGIYGMGGIGKTTLAKAIYNKLLNQFEHHSFIADVRESSRNGVHYLQNQLIRDILQQKIEVCNKDEGTNLISSRCKGKKVIILLDDVDDIAQLHYLVRKRDWFSSGSIIIITTRNQKILKQFGVDNAYEHKEMDEVHSLILFSKHAFRRDSPPREFKDLAHGVVSISGGLPLCLEVLGSLLCGETPEFWRGKIDKLREVPDQNVMEKLMISYEALDNTQKQIFLDIACFFIGTDRRIASYMWEACPFFPAEGIEVLRFMSLIKIEDHVLKMHDQLRDLGRMIVHKEDQQQPWHRSRLWNPEDALKVLKWNKGTDKIEAINLSKGSSEGFGKTAQRDNDIYTKKQFENLMSLRFLDLEGAHLRGDFGDTLEELKWLRWPNCRMDNEVKNFHANELAVLELYDSEINEKWKGWSSFKMAKNLKFLDLSHCGFLEHTDFLSAFKNLEVLILNHCGRLQRIDSSIGDMKALLRLDLNYCMELRQLPEEIGELKALEQLLLRATKALSALPDSIELLENLEILDICFSGIQRLPNGIWRLGKLQKLDASECENLEAEMPQSLSDLSSLHYLDFEGCSKLQSLPDPPPSLTYLGVTCQSRNLPSLSHLKRLRVSCCHSLECIQALSSTLSKNSESSQLTDIEESESELPQSLTTPFKLESLEVVFCGSIETLDVSQFIHLRTLFVVGCNNPLEVRGLDNLIHLEDLTLNWTLIEQLDCTKLVGLKRLGVDGCNKLVEIHGLDRLESLESLGISLSTSIERLLLPKSRSMKKLIARGCESLANIQGLDRLEFLESLDIFRCTSIETLLLPKSGSMKILCADGCENLAKIEGLDTLMFLEELYIAKCTSIERLDLPKSGRMKELYAEGCKNLAKIEGLDTLEFLEKLYIDGCTSIKMLDLSKSKRLKIVKAGGGKGLGYFENFERLEILDFLYDDKGMNELCGGCKNLAEIQGLDKLEFLESLIISECTSIEMLLLPKSGSMKILRADGCENLAKIEGLNTLMFLEELYIARCTSIERLDLPKSGRMKILFARSCEKLTEIKGLDKLEFLEMLSIQDCSSIERLDLSKSGRLKKLEAGGCKSLAEIQGLDRLEFLEKLDIEGSKIREAEKSQKGDTVKTLLIFNGFIG